MSLGLVTFGNAVQLEDTTACDIAWTSFLWQIVLVQPPLRLFLTWWQHLLHVLSRCQHMCVICWQYHVGLVMQSRISLQKLLGPGWPASPYLTAAPKDGLQVDIATWFAGKSPHGTPMACTKDKWKMHIIKRKRLIGLGLKQPTPGCLSRQRLHFPGIVEFFGDRIISLPTVDWHTPWSRCSRRAKPSRKPTRSELLAEILRTPRSLHVGRFSLEPKDYGIILTHDMYRKLCIRLFETTPKSPISSFSRFTWTPIQLCPFWPRAGTIVPKGRRVPVFP